MTAMDITIHASFLPHDDPDAALAFYRDTLGFEVRNDVGYGGLSGLWTHAQELVRKRKEEERTDWTELGNLILDAIYHLILTWMSLQIPGVWSFE